MPSLTQRLHSRPVKTEREMSAPVAGRWARLDMAVRWLMAALLVTTGTVHILQSPRYDIGVGWLFYGQGCACFAVAVALILSGLVEPVLFAGAVAGVSLLAVVESVYVKEQHPGFFPVLYEPRWFVSKSLTAVAEGAVLALALWVLAVRKVHRGHPQAGAVEGVELRLVPMVLDGLLVPEAKVMLPPTIPTQRRPLDLRQRIRTSGPAAGAAAGR